MNNNTIKVFIIIIINLKQDVFILFAIRVVDKLVYYAINCTVKLFIIRCTSIL